MKISFVKKVEGRQKIKTGVQGKKYTSQRSFAVKVIFILLPT